MDNVAHNMIVFADPDAVAVEAAKRVTVRAKARDGKTAICLAGGPSPKRLYELLGAVEYGSQIPWDRVHWFTRAISA